MYSLADTATRLLKVIRARQPAEVTEEIQLRYGEILFSESSEEATVGRALEASTTATSVGVGGDGLSGEALESVAEDPGASRTSSSEEEREELPAHRVGLANLPRHFVASVVLFLLVCLWLIGGILYISRPNTHVDLSGANLKEMDLTGRELRFANLAGADMTESVLRMEDLSSVNMEGADLHKADLSNATLTNANLRDTNLRNAKMEYTDVSGATLFNADMDAVDLRNSKLNDAVLTGANLVGADLRGANLNGADLKGAILILQVRDLLRRDPTEAVFDETTILPDGSNWTADTDMTEFTGPTA